MRHSLSRLHARRPALAGVLALVCCVLVVAASSSTSRSGSAVRDLAEVQKELELRPDDSKLLLEAANAAFADDDDDAALWYAELARLAAPEGKDAKAVDKAMKSLRSDIGVDLPPIGTAVDAHAKGIFQFAKLCSGGKLYANAADVLGSLKGTPYEDDATSRLQKLFKSKKAIGAMLESGVPVKVEVRKRRSAKELARLNKKHAEWDNAYEAKGKFYTIKTNMGVEWAEQILGAMEQMNLFYRKVFDYKAAGSSSMRSCEVRVWATRDGFDAHNPDTKESVAGFYSPSENSVSTYDPRTARGFMKQDIEDLWSTLYHEASHQFTRMKWRVLIPTWLNEGTASYFEGAALLPGGYVETNRIPQSRLRSVVIQIGGGDPANPRSVDALEPPPGRPDLWDVVTYFQPGSYPGTHYSFGWAMVYFCMNYENEDSERIYTPVYRAFMDSYMESGEEKNVGKRFKQYFVEEAEIPGVETYEDLEKRWKEWVLALSRIEFGGPEQAEVLIERARKQLENGKKEYAVDSLRWALRKRVNDPTALQLLGDTLSSMKPKGKESKTKYKDGALFAYRALVNVARGQRDLSKPLKHYDGTGQEALDAGLAGISEINGALGDILAKQYDEFIDNALAEANAWVEGEYPRLGLQVLKVANEVVGGEGRLLARADEIRAESEVDVRRTRRLPTGPDLEDWTASNEGGWGPIADDDGTTGLHWTVAEEIDEITLGIEPPATYRYDVDVLMEESEDGFLPMIGMTFAGGLTGNKVFVRLGRTGRSGLLQIDEDGQPVFEPTFKGGGRMKKGKPFSMGIEVGQFETKFFIDDEEVGSIEASSAAFAGKIGIFAGSARVRFMNPRLTY